MVYVKSIDGKALMPTSNAKARKLLKQKKAKVVSLRPFVVKLTYKTKTEYIQKLNLGVDSGYSNIVNVNIFLYKKWKIIMYNN